MKKTALFFVLAAFAGCNSNTQTEIIESSVQEDVIEYHAYGDTTITPDGAIAVAELPEMFKERDSIKVKLEGTISGVCKKKGCWMTLDMGNEKTVRVKFKDYEFFVPMNSENQTAIIEGYAYMDEISVEELKHLASDAGKTEEEIAEITEPKVEYSFMADGVLLY